MRVEFSFILPLSKKNPILNYNLKLCCLLPPQDMKYSEFTGAFELGECESHGYIYALIWYFQSNFEEQLESHNWVGTF